MAFVRKKNKTFKWPVEVKEPSSDRPGEFETSEFVAIFKRVKMSELEKMGDATGLPFLEKILVGWEGIEEDGEPLASQKSYSKSLATMLIGSSQSSMLTPTLTRRVKRETKGRCGLLGFWRQAGRGQDPRRCCSVWNKAAGTQA